MSNPWFRLYAEFYHDPKVQILSEQDQRRLVMIFCLRCNGSVTLQDKYVTFSLRISDTDWQQSKACFIEAGFIDSDNNILNWDKRQYISDSSAARVAKHRALHKPVTVTPSNVTVTPPEQIQNRTDTEQKQRKPIARNAQLSESFQPTDEHFELASKEGVNLHAELIKFTDYHKAKGSVMKDWNAALRTWIRNAAQFAKKNTPSQTQADQNKTAADLLTGRSKPNVTRPLLD